MAVTSADIREAVQRLELQDARLCVHASLRSFGWVEGGSRAIIEALLAEGCTVMVPSFSWGFAVPPPPEDRPARNGCDYGSYPAPTAGVGRIYSPETTEIDRRDMGVVAATVVQWPGRARGNHPLCSFSAVGPLADELVCGQKPLDAFGPLAALAEHGGFVVLMGVGLDRLTLLHLAEKLAGRNPFRRWANDREGQPIQVETGGCAGWRRLGSVVAQLTAQTTVGDSRWRVLPARQTLGIAARAIRRDPGITHCGDPECLRCNDAVRGGPIL